MKNPRDNKPRSRSGKPDQPRGGFVKKGKVWRSDKAQETARGGHKGPTKRPTKGPPKGPLRRPASGSNPPREPQDEDRHLQARALAGTGPGGYTKFSDIPAHKSGRGLRGDLYQIANLLPEDERGNLASRIKHAATTVTASLAAGFGEGTFRAGVNRALESRGALMALQDLLDQVLEQKLAEQESVTKAKTAAEKTIAAVNEYLGRLAKEREKNLC